MTQAFLFVFGVIAGAYAAGAVIRLVRDRRPREDDALHITPPRRYVDADGNSKFREVTADAVRRYRESQR